MKYMNTYSNFKSLSKRNYGWHCIHFFFQVLKVKKYACKIILFFLVIWYSEK